MRGGLLLGKALVGGLATLVASRVVAGMKKADGTPRLTAGQQTAVQGALAGAAALGAAALGPGVASDALEGVGVVMGGSAVISAAVQYRIPERVQGLMPGQQQTPPAAGLYALPESYSPAAGLYAQPYSYAHAGN